MKSGPGRPVHQRRAGKRNPPGSKIARKFAEHAGVEWRGVTVVHGGELAVASNARSIKRAEIAAVNLHVLVTNAYLHAEHLAEVAYDNDEVSAARSSRHYPQSEGEAVV